MRDTIEMTREAGLSPVDFLTTEQIKAFEALVRADERETAQAEHEADKVIIEYHEATIKRLEAALDLALEALEHLQPTALNSFYTIGVRDKAITAIKQARALDKMAENARELGLDYEPAGGTQVSKVWWDGEKLMAEPIPLEDIYQPAPVQEPVALQMDVIVVNLVREGINKHRARELAEHFIKHTTPPAAQRQWVKLTLSDREKLRDRFEGWNYPAILVDAINDILKEKNT